MLETKFHIPLWRRGGVSRPRLLERLDAGLVAHRKLALIAAPAGYGKTTLLAEWLSDHRKIAKSVGNRVLPARATWLSLDEADNDPARFLSYWTAALQRLDETLAQRAQSLLGMPQLPPLTAILDELINDLAALETQIVLVLDDYHVITNPRLHDALAYFVTYQPAQVHLVIATREDPPLPLAQLRARGEMTEIRAHDLRFTPDEARRFFSQSMHLDLDSRDVETLETRTEGWIAGLQLAALALRHQPDREDFLADFSGSHRHIVDYLLDEVLARQPPEIRDFLVKTAPLERFCAELCEAVTGNPAATETLSRLDRANLFLVPLESGRSPRTGGWYRYHHLFADVLRAGRPAEITRETHRRAAMWFEEQQLCAEAIPHWLAVPDPSEAAHLIGRLAPDLIKNGELQTLLNWLSRLPASIVDGDADLTTYKVLSLLMTGEIRPAREYAAQAAATFARQSSETGHGRLLSMQAWLASTTGKTQNAELAQAALDQLDEDDLFFRALAMISLGTAYGWGGDLPASTEAFRDTWLLGRQMNHPFIALGALANLAFNLLDMGELREAESLCRAAFDAYVDSRGNRLPVVSIIYAPLAAICYEQADFDEAQALAEDGIELTRRLFSNTIMGGDNEVTLARIALERGRPENAMDLLQAATASARQRGMAIVVHKMAIAQAELYLLLDRLAAADLKLHELETQAQSSRAKSGRLVKHLRARYLIASDEPQEALAILDGLEQSARDGGATRWLMGVHLSQAMAYQKMGDLDEARDTFEATVRLAAPEGYRSLFLPHAGRPTRALLYAARPVAPQFVDGVLEIAGPADEGFSPIAAQLPEPLTDQEQRVLGLIVEGKTNREIADELVIAVGTAKWHVHNVLQKLDVNNRAQAIVRAHELGIA